MQCVLNNNKQIYSFEHLSTVKEGIVLGHKIAHKGIEVDKGMVEVIDKLPLPTSLKAIRSSLGHTSFYRRFI